LSELALRQQRESPPPLNRLNPSVPPELARVVAMALAIDQEDRPIDGLVLAEAIRTGAQGIDSQPATAATAHLGTSAATNVMPAREGTTAATRIAPAKVASTPRTSAPRRRPAAAAEPPPTSAPRRAPARQPAKAAAPSRTGRAMRRLLVLLLLALVFVVAVVVAVIVVNSTSKTVVHARSVATHDVQTAIKDLQGLINQYTK